MGICVVFSASEARIRGAASELIPLEDLSADPAPPDLNASGHRAVTMTRGLWPKGIKG
jgi:hypothetical protein